MEIRSALVTVPDFRGDAAGQQSRGRSDAAERRDREPLPNPTTTEQPRPQPVREEPALRRPLPSARPAQADTDRVRPQEDLTPAVRRALDLFESNNGQDEARAAAGTIAGIDVFA